MGHPGAVSSVAIHDGLAALAIDNTRDRTRPGVTAFLDTRGRQRRGTPVTVGALPDMLTFTPEGRSVRVANEETPNARPTPAGPDPADPPGSASISDLRSRRVTTLAVDPSMPGDNACRKPTAAPCRICAAGASRRPTAPG